MSLPVANNGARSAEIERLAKVEKGPYKGRDDGFG
jgi:hypothetical protein